MPAAPLPAYLDEFLEGPRACVVAAVRSDGAPVSACCWYEYAAGRVTLSMERGGHRERHLRGNPRVALTVLGDDWYRHLSLLGVVVELRDDAGLVDLDRLSMRYLGEPYSERAPCVTAVVEVTHWHSYGLEPGPSPS